MQYHIYAKGETLRYVLVRQLSSYVALYTLPEAQSKAKFMMNHPMKRKR